MCLDTIHLGRVAADALLAKALMISEVAQMSRAEVRMREFLIGSWNKRKAKAEKRAVELAEKLKSPSEITKEIDKIMEGWAGEASVVVEDEMDLIFRLGLNIGYKKATRQTKADLNYVLPKTNDVDVEKAGKKKVAEILPSFTIADERAIDALKKHQVFWIGEHYKKNVSKTIGKRVKQTMLEAGESPLKAGKLMRVKVRDALTHVKVPGGFNGTNLQYFEGVSANAATVARVNGQLRSFASIGIRSYRISAVNDRRTCDRCSHMDGKVFQTSQGLSQMSSVLDAKTPNAVKAAHPWPNSKELKAISSKAGPQSGKAGVADAKALSSAGLAMPPYHFKCRCTVDISDDIRSYDQLLPMSVPAPKKPPSAAFKPKPKPKPKKKPLVPEKISASELAKEKQRISDLESAKYVESHALGVGVNDAHLVTFKAKTGEEIKGIYKSAASEYENIRPGLKTGTYYKREVALYELDKALGGAKVVPPTVVRDIKKLGGKGSLQFFEKDAKMIDHFGEDDVAAFLKAKGAADPTLRKTFLLDIISGNDDRHSQNIMFKMIKGGKGTKRIGKAVAIDNGLTFPRGHPIRFMFPGDVYVSTGDYTTKLLALDKISHAQVKKLDLKKVAAMLKKNGVERHPIKQALVRIRALQKDPKAIANIKTQYHLEPDQKVEMFFEKSVDTPYRLVGNKDHDKILKIVAEIFD